MGRAVAAACSATCMQRAACVCGAREAVRHVAPDVRQGTGGRCTSTPPGTRARTLCATPCTVPGRRRYQDCPVICSPWRRPHCPLQALKLYILAYSTHKSAPIPGTHSPPHSSCAVTSPSLSLLPAPRGMRSLQLLWPSLTCPHFSWNQLETFLRCARCMHPLPILPLLNFSRLALSSTAWYPSGFVHTMLQPTVQVHLTSTHHAKFTCVSQPWPPSLPTPWHGSLLACVLCLLHAITPLAQDV